MSMLKSLATICLPAHILDANVSPRAREVLMLLASQTTIEHPAVWVCHAAIAEKLRCSPITVKRAIQKLVETKLVVETGDLHERRFKFYRVRWSLNEKAVSKCVVRAKKLEPAPAKVETTPSIQPIERPKPTPTLKPTEHALPRHPGIDQAAFLKDSRIAYWAEVARQKHQENLQRYRMERQILERTHPGEFGEFNEGLDNPHEGL